MRPVPKPHRYVGWNCTGFVCAIISGLPSTNLPPNNPVWRMNLGALALPLIFELYPWNFPCPLSFPKKLVPEEGIEPPTKGL